MSYASGVWFPMNTAPDDRKILILNAQNDIVIARREPMSRVTIYLTYPAGWHVQDAIGWCELPTMNDQLQTALADILTSLTDATQQVGAVTQEQLPILVQEYLAWGLTEALVYVVFWLAVIWAAVAMHRKSWIGYDEDAAFFLRLPIPAVMGAIGIVICISNVMTAAQIWVAPRVYLVDQLRMVTR